MSLPDIDHVTVAGSDLERLRAVFAGVGLATDYGGPHSNGITHMALLGFSDGSYLELISTLQPGAESPVWNRHIREDGGPAAWAVAVADIGAETERLRAAGVPVVGPSPWHRVRPDGVRIEWDLAFPGDGPTGSTLPFLIQDRTPRELRVRPSACLEGTKLTGVSAVVLGVRSLDGAVAAFRRAYGWPRPQVTSAPVLAATVASFAGTPVLLAAPATARSWLTDRLARFGESPCAFLIHSRDVGASARRFGLGESDLDDSLGCPVLWLGRPGDSDGTAGIGIVG